MSGPGVNVELDTSGVDSMLGKLADALEPQLMIAVGGAAALVAATAKTTRSFNDRDGRLRGSIRGEPAKIDRDGAIAADALAGGGEVYYAPYIEFGTSTKDGGTAIRARRYMRDALELHEADITEIVDGAVARAIEIAEAGP